MSMTVNVYNPSCSLLILEGKKKGSVLMPYF